SKHAPLTTPLSLARVCKLLTGGGSGTGHCRHRLSVLSIAAAALMIETDDGDGSVVSRRERRWLL
ncbi:hypothetical protein A2U01_0071579, partial [Trifolium medium]|nr:hypothetical protein [Trifolium medium]